MFRQVEAVDSLPFPLCALSPLFVLLLVGSRSWFRHWGRGERGRELRTLGSSPQSSWLGLEFWPRKTVATTPRGTPDTVDLGRAVGDGGRDGEHWVGL